jgi:hypothetical protein
LETIATRRLSAVAVGLLTCSALGALLAPIAAAESTLKFTEPEKGSTFHYVDVAPTAPTKHGFPTVISPGDQIVLTNPLRQGTQTIGKLRARCTATANVKATDPSAFVDAHFICEGVFTFGKSMLFANAAIVKGGTEGVITGGTGNYAGARGTILSKEVKGGSSTTIDFIG